MKIAHSLEQDLLQQKQKNKELEEYLDVLLLKVMETHPRILQNPYQQRGQNLKQRYEIINCSTVYLKPNDLFYLNSG